MSGKLYVVGTPIGNLEDFSPRAKRILETADFIAAEDTRVTLKLLNHFGIKKEMISYYEHNKLQKGNLIIERLLNGESCAVVSDAGMPAISDPGEDIVRLSYENGIEVECVPGPSALVSAISISGMPSGRFCFEGFLSVNRPNRREHLKSLENEHRTMVFYEAPHKLNTTLNDFLQTFGDRKITIVKELTKVHETVFRTTLKEACEYFAENTPKGEYVLIVEGAPQEARDRLSCDEAVELALKLADGGLSASAAAKQAAQLSGAKKGDIYRQMLEKIK